MSGRSAGSPDRSAYGYARREYTASISSAARSAMSRRRSASGCSRADRTRSSAASISAATWARGGSSLREFPPVLSENRIFQLTDDGVLSALDKYTGKVKYKVSDELASYSSPVLATIDKRP